MSLFTLLLVVLASLVHATWNLLSKKAASAGPAFVFSYTFVATALYLPWAAYLVLTEGSPWGLPMVLCILASGVLHLAYSLFLQRGYQVADLSVVYPVARGTGPLISTLAAFLFLGEPVTAYGVTGLVAVVLGIVLISTRGRLAMLAQPEARVGVRWGALTGSMIAGYTVVDAYAVKVVGIHPVVLDWFGNLVRLIALFPFVLRNRSQSLQRMQGKWGLALAVGALSPLSYILVLWALRLGAPLSVVAPAREMSMMVGVMMGMVILREQVGFWRTFGCALVIFGVIALANVNTG